MSPGGRLPRCRDCGARIRWLRWEPTGRMRKFDHTPVSGRTHVGAQAYPVDGGVLAWRLLDLITDLQARRECSEPDARAEVYDMPWFVPHFCPNAAASEKES